MNLLETFKRMMAHKRVPEEFLVPLLIWSSGSEKNIENAQKVNKKFFGGNRHIYIYEVSLNNNIEHFIKYPKVSKDIIKNKFFYNDICAFYGWTPKELEKNLSILNFRTLKPYIAKVFGYTEKECKLIGLEAIKYGKSKKIRRPSSTRVTETKSFPYGSKKGSE